MRHILTLATSSSLLVLLAACGGSGSSNPPGGPTVTVDGQTVSIARASDDRVSYSSVSSSDLSGAVDANNAFAVDLYAQLRAKSASENLLTSPLSASLALTMTYAGAIGPTATQMATALHYGASGSIFEGQNALSQALASRGTSALSADAKIAKENGEAAPSPSDYQLQVVNSVWGEKTYTWNAPFLKILAQDYGTGVYLEDFVNEFDPARLLINSWVSDETADKINDLLPEGSLDKSTRMVLVNAVHLKLPWANPFDKGLTVPASFTTAATTKVSTPFMNQTGTLAYVDDGTAQIVGLPLSNDQLAVVIALPHGDLATYEAGLSAGSAGIAMPTGTALVALSVPKVTFTSPTFSLATALQAMGMTQAFDPLTADFKGLCSQPPDGDNLYISNVLQKAMIAMQETGVEAAAATAVLVAGAGAEPIPPPTPTPMIVNRPYVLSIVDVPTGAVLFLGHIVDPTQGS
jgi:serpin B